MDIQEKRLELVQLLLSIEEESILSEIEMLLKGSSHVDWWDYLNDNEKASINKGIDEANTGNLITHDQVMEEVFSKYNLKRH